MMKNDLRSQTLDLLRFPLAVVVLISHVFGSQGQISDPFFKGIRHIIVGFFSGQSVPVYFFISGFVFFLGVDWTKEKYIQKLKNRVKTLFIPYIIWNTVAVFLLVSIKLLSFLPSEVKLNPTFSAFLSCYWVYKGDLTPSVADNYLGSTNPIDLPLWFIRDLMIVVLCTPILHYGLKYMKHYLVLLLGGLWFFLSYLELGHIQCLLTAFFFFSWGAYMSLNKKDMLTEFGKYFKLSIFFYPLFASLYIVSVYHFPTVSSTIKMLNTLVGLLFAYNLARWLLQHKVCKLSSFLASSSFFIYVAHTLVCYRILHVFLLLLTPHTGLSLLMVNVLSILFTVGSLLLVFYILRRFFPSFLQIVTGRK